VALLALLSLGLYYGGRNLWAAYHFRAAQRALGQRDWIHAHDHLLLCLRAWPQSAETHLLAARACRQLDNYDEAEQHLNACREAEKVHDAVELERALLSAQRGELSRVQGYLLACVQQNHPDSGFILEALTKGYVQTHQVTRALDCADRWVQNQPENADAFFCRARLKEQLYAYQKAIEDYRRAVELNPGYDQARLRLAEHLIQSGEAEEALVHFERLAQDQPENFTVLLGLARCRNELHQAEQARPLLDRLLAEHPSDGAVLVEHAKLALHTGQLAEAENYLRKAVAAAPYDRTANNLLAECLQQRGRRDEAKVYEGQAERIQSELQRLKELMRQIVDVPPDSSVRYEIGTILLRNGHEQEGLDWLQSLLKLDPHHRPAHETLSDYYQHKGNQVLAARHRQLAQEGGKSQ
jgi:tetratricopeptide (TPR) repeat protein